MARLDRLALPMLARDHSTDSNEHAVVPELDCVGVLQNKNRLTS
jgi:hypothetical protein